MSRAFSKTREAAPESDPPAAPIPAPPKNPAKRAWALSKLA